jgi:hypothetical protein
MSLNTSSSPKIIIPKIDAQDGNANAHCVYNFILAPGEFQWSGTFNASVYYKGEFVNMDELPMDEQIKRIMIHSMKKTLYQKK